MLSGRNRCPYYPVQREKQMKTRICIIKKDTPAGNYFGDICRWSKALRNTTNFYIRNT